MKKFTKVIIVLLLFLLVPLVGCGNNNSGTSDKISYYKDFKFLPMYPGAEKISYTPPEGEGYLGKGSYKIPSEEINLVVENYAKILEKDGWTVKKQDSNPFIDCTKGDHTAGILVSEKENVLTIEILAK